MHQSLFQRIEVVVAANNDYFTQRRDACGVLGLSSLQKVTAAIRMLAYDKSADELDEYLQLGESTILLCLSEFCDTMVSVFGPEYLRSPTTIDTERILHHSVARGFPGMIRSIDCMHWDWKNCPCGWAGQFQDRAGCKSFILEAVATYDLWIWHSYFGILGSNNDLNVLDRSPLFNDLLRGRSSTSKFTIHRCKFDQTYYLVDLIYPNWPVFVHTITNPLSEKCKHFAKVQEVVKKDIERAFGVLQARFAILQHGFRLWSRSTLLKVMLACITLHNLIVEEEQEAALDCLEWSEVEVVDRSARDNINSWPERFAEYMTSSINMRNKPTYHLQENLVEHLWSRRQVRQQ